MPIFLGEIGVLVSISYIDDLFEFPPELFFLALSLLQSILVSIWSLRFSGNESNVLVFYLLLMTKTNLLIIDSGSSSYFRSLKHYGYLRTPPSFYEFYI